MNYKQKYLKYKEKYILSKNIILYGGETFDIIVSTPQLNRRDTISVEHNDTISSLKNKYKTLTNIEPSDQYIFIDYHLFINVDDYKLDDFRDKDIYILLADISYPNNPNPPYFNVTINQLDGKKYVISVKDTDTFFTLILKISILRKINPDRIILLLNGKKVNNETKLNEQNINSQSLFYIQIKMHEPIYKSGYFPYSYDNYLLENPIPTPFLIDSRTPNFYIKFKPYKKNWYDQIGNCDKYKQLLNFTSENYKKNNDNRNDKCEYQNYWTDTHLSCRIVVLQLKEELSRLSDEELKETLNNIHYNYPNCESHINFGDVRSWQRYTSINPIITNTIFNSENCTFICSVNEPLKVDNKYVLALLHTTNNGDIKFFEDKLFPFTVINREYKEGEEQIQLLEKNYEQKLEQLALLIKQFEKNQLEFKKCSICFTNDKDTILNCGHLFCNDCSNQVVNCPTCRQVINTLNRAYLKKYLK